jgi:outer membrane protein assembly factor BamB
MARSSALMLVCVAVLVSGIVSLAADRRPAEKIGRSTQWTQWRGEHRDNISPDKGLASQWPADGPPMLWKVNGMGRGFSSISIADGRIYTMGDRDAGQFVIALDADSGAPLWSTRIGDVWEPQGYAGPRCTPTVDGDLVYAVGPHGDLVCLQAKDGKEVWHRSLKSDFGGTVPHWGFSESPLIDGQKLVCTPGGSGAGIVALDKKKGTDVWRSSIPSIGDRGGDGAGYSSIVISNGAGVRQYVQLMGRGVVSVAADDGKFLWGYNRVANGTANVPTPLVRDDFIFCSSGYQTGAALLKLRAASGSVQADEQYFLDGKEFQNHHGGMIMLGDHVYAGHGHNAGAPTALEWKTGKTAWRHNRGPGTGSAAVAYADGNLYFRFQNGVMALIGATPLEYQERGHFKIPDVEQPSWSHPVVIGGRMYLREQDALMCYDVRK